MVVVGTHLLTVRVCDDTLSISFIVNIDHRFGVGRLWAFFYPMAPFNFLGVLQEI